MVRKKALQKVLDKKPSAGKEKQSRSTVEASSDITDCSSQRPLAQRKRKREDLKLSDKKSRRQKERSRMNTKGAEQNVDSADRISQLPDHIIHQILASVRCKKDVARTCILSKRWRDIWTSFDNLVFDQRNFVSQESQEVFRNYVYTTMQSRVDQNVYIQKFTLHLTYYNPGEGDHVDGWINAAIGRNITDLDLHLPIRRRKPYNLPETVFAAKSITSLRVYGCRLGTCSDIKVSQLQKLCLGELKVDEQMIENLISSCPLIEDFRLIYCSGLKTLELSNLPKLKRVDLHFCRGLKKVELLAPSLEIFWYQGKKSVPCKINLSECRSLKSLTLEDATLKDEQIQTHLSSFPLLESLELRKCNVKNITISGFRLKKLIFRDCRRLVEADIDTPNLLSLEYKGCKMPFSSFNPSGLREAKIYFEIPKDKSKAGFCYGDKDRTWFVRLQEFLSKFDYSKGSKLVIRYKKDIIIYEDTDEIVLPPIFGLKLDVIKSSLAFEDLLDHVLRTWHPETLTILSSSGKSFTKLARKKMMDNKEEPSCCRYNIASNKCWRHFLEHVKSENLHFTKSTSPWICWLKTTTATMPKTTCFRIKWKPYKPLTDA